MFIELYFNKSIAEPQTSAKATVSLGRYYNSQISTHYYSLHYSIPLILYYFCLIYYFTAEILIGLLNRPDWKPGAWWLQTQNASSCFLSLQHQNIGLLGTTGSNLKVPAFLAFKMSNFTRKIWGRKSKKITHRAWERFQSPFNHIHPW